MSDDDSPHPARLSDPGRLSDPALADDRRGVATAGSVPVAGPVVDGPETPPGPPGDGDGDGGGSGDGPAEGSGAGKRGGFFRELPFLVVVAFALALIIKAFLVQAFYIPSGSMEQTLAIRDRVLVNKLVYDVRDVHRGEVIVFNGAGSFSPDPDQEILTEPTNPVRRALDKVGGLVGLGAPGETDFIKRVIGLPGDRVACCTDGKVTVQPAGGTPVTLDEPYTYENDSPMTFCEAGATDESCPAGSPGVLVPKGRLFVMGDHRCCSSDSRLHLDDGQMGTVPEDEVIGRAFVVVWPLDHITLLKVPGDFGQRALSLAGPATTGVPYALGAVAVLPVGLLRHRRRRRRG